MTKLSRREEREIAFQLTFAKIMNSDHRPQETLELIGSPSEYGLSLYEKVNENFETIQSRVIPNLKGWTIDRIPPVDLATAYVAIQEMDTSLDVPFKVAVDEALNLCKKFGGLEGTAFINALLDRMKK